MATNQLVVRSADRIPVEAREFSQPTNSQTGSGAHPSLTLGPTPAFCLVGDRAVRLTAHFHLEPRLRMSGVIPPSAPPICLNGAYKGNFIFLPAAEASVSCRYPRSSLIYPFTAEQIH